MRIFEIKQVFSTDNEAMKEIARVRSASNRADGIGGEVDTMLEEMKATWNGDYILVMYLDGEAVGVSSDSQIGDCLTIWVAPENRSKGIEDALLFAMEALYRQHGVSKASAPIELPEWLNELLQRNGYVYRGGDELSKNLSRETALVV